MTTLELIYHCLPKGCSSKMTPKFLNENYPKVAFPKLLEGKKISPELFAKNLKFSFFVKLQEKYKDKFQWRPNSLDSIKFQMCKLGLELVYNSKAIKEFLQKFPVDDVSMIRCEVSHNFLVIDLQVIRNDGTSTVVEVFPFESFSGNKKEGRMKRLDLWMKAAASEADNIVAVLPWKRDVPIMSTGFSPLSHAIINSTLIRANEITESSKELWTNWSIIYETNLFIGHHRRKEALDEILDAVASEARPFQIFLLGNRGNKGEGPALDRLGDAYAGCLTEYRGYVHAPYSLSLARKNVSQAKDAPSIASAAQKYLEVSSKMGFKGVVFHVDHCPDLEQAGVNLRENLDILTSLESEASILLENSCGDGNGFMSTPEEMAKVCSEYPLVKVCLDICHAHGAGYDPMDYISSMCFGNGDDGYKVQYHERIGLIHFNGAIKTRGCHADGHATMRFGQHLSFAEVDYVLGYARARELSCIIE